jgi:hypothetical protein
MSDFGDQPVGNQNPPVNQAGIHDPLAQQVGNQNPAAHGVSTAIRARATTLINRLRPVVDATETNLLKNAGGFEWEEEDFALLRRQVLTLTDLGAKLESKLAEWQQTILALAPLDRETELARRATYFIEHGVDLLLDGLGAAQQQAKIIIADVDAPASRSGSFRGHASIHSGSPVPSGRAPPPPPQNPFFLPSIPLRAPQYRAPPPPVMTIKLPKRPTPEFAGDARKWPAFWQSF